MKLPIIEQVIQKILKKNNLLEPPINLDKVIESFNGLKISFEDLEDEGVIVDLGKHGGEIIINKNNIDVRQRYTIAHELGHWILKEHNIPIEMSNIRKRRFEIENWCNKFAAELLMPRKWIQNEVRNCKDSDILELLEILPNKFKVSKESIKIRIAETVPIRIYEIISNDRLRNIEIEKKYSSYKKGGITYKKKLIENIKRINRGGIFYENNRVFIYQFMLQKNNYTKWIVIEKNKNISF